MSLTEAKSLASRAQTENQSTIIQERDPNAERSALARLAEYADAYSPIVGIETTEYPECLWMDVTGLANLYGSEQELAWKVVLDFQDLGYLAYVAIADTIGLAWGLTRYRVALPPLPSPDRSGSRQVAPNRRGPLHESKNADLTEPQPASAKDHQLAKRANDFGRHLPPPLIAPPGEFEILGQLPIEGLRLQATDLDTLHQLGITHVEQLLRLPRASLASRLGDEVIRRLDEASGRKDECILAHRPPGEFSSEHALEFPTRNRDALTVIVERCIEQVARNMLQKQAGALRLQCDLICSRNQKMRLNVGLFQPTASARHLMQLVQMQLERLQIPGEVQQVQVNVSLTAPLVQQQVELFHQKKESRQALAHLINCLSSRLGESAVLGVELRSEAQPEYAFRYRSLAGQLPRNGELRKRRAKSNQLIPMQRPLKLYQAPIELSVVSASSDSPPALFHFQGQRFHVLWYRGPERIETGWWRRPAVRRDYYQLETTTGHRFWLFHNLRDQKWFLHGEF